MRAEPDELQDFIVGFAIDQDEIGPDMAVAMIFPFAGECMVS